MPAINIPSSFFLTNRLILPILIIFMEFLNLSSLVNIQ